MDHLKATIQGDIRQCIFSLCVLILIIIAFLFVPDILLLFAVVLGLFGVMALFSAVLSLVELHRAKYALQRMEESQNASEHTVSVQIQKVILLSRPAPKYDEYLICALMTGPEKKTYIYPFPKEVDGSAPIRSDIRKKLTAQPLTLTCRGDTGVVSSIEGFSLDPYPVTSYRPTLRRKK